MPAVLLTLIPLVIQYGPDAIVGVKKIIDAVRAHPSTSDEEKALLDKAEADLDAAAKRVADAKLPND